jgi:outer membrane protein OmpA-like peptidoglycan-associated protein
MRQIRLLLPLLLIAANPAFAQVTVDLHALDVLPGARPATREPPARRAAPRPAPRPLAAKTSKPPTPAASATPAPTAAPTASATPPATATPQPPAATLPTTAPPSIALAPIAPPSAAPAAPPPPPPISDSASSAATTTGADSLRVTFGAGETDLSPTSAAAIHALVQKAPSGDTTSFNVVAYAAGTPDDPSTARRLSLTRALAVRSALIADGVSSARIYVRALGAASGDEPPDRVDVAVLGANSPAATPASAAQAPAPPGAKSQQQ